MSEEVEIPSNWKVVPLESVISLKKGKKPKDLGEFSGTRNIPYIDIKAFETGEIRKYCTDEKTVLCKEDDVLIVWDGSRSGLVGFGAKGAVGSTIAKIDPSGLFSKYLYYFLQSNFVYLNTNTRGVGIPHVDPGVFKSLEFPVAPFEQQKRIVAKIEELFSHIDAGIEALKKAQKLLKQYRQSVLKAAVTGELTKEWREANKGELEPASQLLERILKERRQKWEEQQLKQFQAKGKMPKDDKWKGKYKEPKSYEGDLFPLPEEWCWAYIGQLGQVIGGLTKNRKREQFELQLPYLRVANVYANELRLDDVTKIGVQERELERLLLETGDLLVVEGNGSPDQIGRLAVWDGSIDPCVHQNHLIKIRLIEKESGEFLMHWLGSMGGRNAILDVASSTSGLYTLSISKVEGLPVPLAPLEEMIEIETIVGEKHLAIARLERELYKQLIQAEKNKQSILASAFLGKLKND